MLLLKHITNPFLYRQSGWLSSARLGRALEKKGHGCNVVCLWGFPESLYGRGGGCYRCNVVLSVVFLGACMDEVKLSSTLF